MDEKKHKKKWIEFLWLSELFSRYYEGNATEKEKQIVESWEAEKEHGPDLRFLSPDEETDKIWKNISRQFHFKETPKRISKPFYRYVAAASIVIVLGLGLYKVIEYNARGNSNKEQVAASKTYFETKTGERKKMTLSDGSTIYLNSDTKVAIVEREFGVQKREFWLEQGEAFFEVAKDPTRAFVIHSQELQIRVLGTSFNVKSYKELDERVISVREGKVQVSKDKKILGVLTHNKQIIYNKITQRFEKNTITWENEAGWMEGRLVMRKASIKELQLRLKQHFGVVLVVKEGAFKTDTRLNTSFQANASLAEVLDGISMLYGVHYTVRQQGKVILIHK